MKEGYICKGINVRQELYKRVLRHIRRQEKTFTGWLEEKMEEELGDVIEKAETEEGAEGS